MASAGRPAGIVPGESRAGKPFGSLGSPGHEAQPGSRKGDRGGARRASSAEHDDVGSAGFDADRGDRLPDPGDVGVGADEPPALPTDGVDRAHLLRLSFEAVEQRHHRHLVGDGHVGAHRFRFPERRHGPGQAFGGHVDQLVSPVQPCRAEGGRLHGRARRIGDAMPEEHHARPAPRLIQRRTGRPLAGTGRSFSRTGWCRPCPRRSSSRASSGG